MPSYQHNSFESKKPWSVIKDTVLANYIEPYLKKVRPSSSMPSLAGAFLKTARTPPCHHSYSNCRMVEILTHVLCGEEKGSQVSVERLTKA